MARNVVFDLGGVLVDWNPRHLYRKLIADEAEMERFLAEVCTGEWNLRHDAGRPFAEGVAELAGRHPERRALIEAFFARWPEMLQGAIPETVDLLAELKARRVPVYALSNWSAETWPHALARFPFLGDFDGLVISGFERVAKPDAAIFRLLETRFGLDLSKTLFFDDVEGNVVGARAAGLQAHRFVDAAEARRAIRAAGLL